MFPIRAAFFSICLGVLVSSTAYPAYADAFEVLPPELDSLLDIYAVSADGRTVIGHSDWQAAYWTADSGIVTINQPDWNASYPYGVSADGSEIIGLLSRYIDGVYHTKVFRWTADAGVTEYGPDDEAFVMRDASADAAVAVGDSYRLTPSTGQGFRWTQATGLVGLGGASTPEWEASSYVNGVAADGNNIAGYLHWHYHGHFWPYMQAVMWDASNQMIILGPDPGASNTDTQANAVSNDGAIVVGQHRPDPGEWQAVYWESESGLMVPLGMLAGDSWSIAGWVNGDGSTIIGGSSVGGAAYRPFLWTAEAGMRALQDVLEEDYDVDLTGWTLGRLFCMSPDCSIIIGAGVDPGGHTRKWKATLCTDRDGDALCDRWEEHGIDVNGDGVVDLDLPALGADPNRIDIFVEVDAMTGFAPQAEAMDDVIAAFANAPVTNFDGTRGIALHIELEDDLDIPGTASWSGHGTFVFEQFADVQNQYFGTAAQREPNPNSEHILAAKKLAYRYCVFVDTVVLVSPEEVATTVLGVAPCIVADVCLVALGSIDPPGGTRDAQAACFMHELGHCLGLTHGGSADQGTDPFNYKPNYYSVMNYLWNFPSPSHAPDTWRLDYSRSAWYELEELSLYEPLGLQAPPSADIPPGLSVPFRGPSGAIQYALVRTGLDVDCQCVEPGEPCYGYVAVDWNESGDACDVGVPVDINWFDRRLGGGLSLLKGHDDWNNLVYDFRQSAHYQGGAAAAVYMSEITPEIVAEMASFPPAPIMGDCDEDGDLDITDFTNCFMPCFELLGPDIDATAIGCAAMDVDSDNDVDFRDYAWIQMVFTGDQ